MDMDTARNRRLMFARILRELKNLFRKDLSLTEKEIVLSQNRKKRRKHLKLPAAEVAAGHWEDRRVIFLVAFSEAAESGVAAGAVVEQERFWAQRQPKKNKSQLFKSSYQSFKNNLLRQCKSRLSFYKT